MATAARIMQGERRRTFDHLAGHLLGQCAQLGIEALAVRCVQQAANGPGQAVQEHTLVLLGRPRLVVGGRRAVAALGLPRLAGAVRRAVQHARQQRQERADLADLLVVHHRVQCGSAAGREEGAAPYMLGIGRADWRRASCGQLGAACVAKPDDHAVYSPDKVQHLPDQLVEARPQHGRLPLVPRG
jgi:hypothetical protein